MKLSRAFAVTPLAAALAALSPTSHATNGMNLEAFGPVAMSMGGASMAYDSGLAAMMNNPATLALSPNGDQLALAVHFLGPNVAVENVADSGGDAYFMPAMGWARKNGAWTYGVGVFAQGGMGTEYGSSSPLSLDTGKDVRSELGVGRLIVPLAYEVTPNFTVGASVDFVWGMLDINMAASQSQIMEMTGDMMNIDDWGATSAHISFSDDNDFTGKAKGTGWAGKLGLTYKPNSTITLGAAYHSKTNLNNLKTSANGTVMTLFNGTTQLDALTRTGEMAVIDFQWPETYAVGLAWQATPKLMVAADIKRIEWSEVMQNFRMSFTGMPTMTIMQEWKDQDVYSVGLQYRLSDSLWLRAGFNYGKNPVPDARLHPLFPATVEKHVTFGFDYRLSKSSCIAMAMSYAPEASDVTSQGMNVTHSQLSGMLGYNHNF